MPPSGPPGTAVAPRLPLRVSGVLLLVLLGFAPLVGTHPPPGAPFALVLLGLAAGLLAAVGYRDLLALGRPPWVVAAPLAAFLFGVALSWMGSIHPAHSAKAGLDLAVWVVVFLACMRLGCHERWPMSLLTVLTVAGVGIALLAIAQRLFLFDLVRAAPASARVSTERLATDRVFGTFLSPGLYGAFLALLVPWQAGLLDRVASRARGAAGARASGSLVLGVIGGALVLNVTALALTRSRAAWLGAGIGLASYAAITRRGLPRGVVLAGLGAGAGLLALLSPRLLATNTLLARLTYWQATLGMIALRPLLGTGPGTWGKAYPTTFVAGGYPTTLAHNDWLQRTAELGIPGGVAFAVLMAGVLWISTTSWKGASQQQGARLQAGRWSGLIAVCVAACFDYPLTSFSVSWIVAALLGISISPHGAELVSPPFRWPHVALIGPVMVILVGGVILAYRVRRAEQALHEATAAIAGEDLAAFEAKCESARALTPWDAEPYGLLSTLYLRRAEVSEYRELAYQAAAVAGAGAVARSPWDPWLADRAGVAHWRLAQAAGDERARRQAVTFFARAAGHFPAHPAFQRRYASVLTRIGDPKAEQAWARVARAAGLWRETGDIAGPTPLGAELDLEGPGGETH